MKTNQLERSAIDDVVVVIPVYNPDDKFIVHLKNLIETGFQNIIVVNDGSRDDCEDYFAEAHALKEDIVILKHGVNLGQGRAYKTAFNYYLERFADHTIGVIQCDCDGQHHINDILKCYELLKKNPDKFIMGVRSFEDRSIPLRSRFGNSCTRLVFKFFCGLDILDTQTGLKGIPAFFIPIIIQSPGERFEYASSVLLETKKAGVEILQFPIRTIYINGNETSHFNPLLDSIRIYSLILKFLMSSLSAFVVDIVLFSIFLAITKPINLEFYIIISTYLAKIGSCSYSFFVNKNIVFQRKRSSRSSAVRFVVLCIVQATLSGVLVSGVVRFFPWNETISKILVDTFLFFFSYQMQNRWVFER